jgi:Rieske Fe-S protein
MTNNRTSSSDDPAGDLSRRTMLRGAAVGGVAVPLLAACGGGNVSPDASGSAGGSSGSGGKVTVPTADVPVGGGTILTDQKVVVTQPTQGTFKAFTAVCTHQGCTVTKIEGGQIICPCHQSHFSITDGSPVSGPAPAALAAKRVSVKGNDISVS